MLNAFQELLHAQQNNTNPVVAMMLFGSGMMSTALTIWLGVMSFLTVAAIAAGFIPSVDVSNGFTTAAVIFAPLMTAILVPMFVTGTMLLFYLPMVPFMIFTFGGIGWIVGVIEAMIAGPVVAFGVMHPEGGSDLFGKGEQAIMYILNLFLRPPLMIFGLIAGIMISYVGIWMINDGWNLVTPVIYAVEGYDWSSQIAGFIVGLIALPMIYLVMVMQIINRSFAMIHLFPDRITRWLSGGIQESLGSEFSGMEKDARQGVEKGVGHIGDAGKGAASGMGGGARARHKHKLEQDERKKKEGSGGVQAS
jgi:defect-in-organelle-trafficking protein DotA